MLNRESLRALSYLSLLGINFVVTIISGVWLGKQVDELLGTSPWGLFAGSILFTLAAFRNLYVFSLKEAKKRAGGAVPLHGRPSDDDRAEYDPPEEDDGFDRLSYNEKTIRSNDKPEDLREGL